SEPWPAGEVPEGTLGRTARRRWRPPFGPSYDLELATVEARCRGLAIGDGVDAVDPGAVGEREDHGALEGARPGEVLELHLLRLPVRGRADLLELALRRPGGVATGDPHAARDAIARRPGVALRIEERIDEANGDGSADVEGVSRGARDEVAPPDGGTVV